MYEAQLPIDHETGKGNCGLVGMAVATGRTLAEATEAYVSTRDTMRFAVGKRKSTLGRNWKGGTQWRYTEIAVRTLAEVKDLPVPDRMTLRRWIRLCSDMHTVYLIRTRGHIQVVQNGFVIDQKGRVPVAEYWGKNKFVKNVIKVL